MTLFVIFTSFSYLCFSWLLYDLILLQFLFSKFFLVFNLKFLKISDYCKVSIYIYGNLIVFYPPCCIVNDQYKQWLNNYCIRGDAWLVKSKALPSVGNCSSNKSSFLLSLISICGARIIWFSTGKSTMNGLTTMGEKNWKMIKRKFWRRWENILYFILLVGKNSQSYLN